MSSNWHKRRGCRPPCTGIWDGEKCTRCNRRPQVRKKRGPHRARQKKWYDSARWKQRTKTFLARPENVVCAICGDRVAKCIDHVIPPKGNERLFWDPSNHQPACLKCNREKGARE